jgi:DNA-binding phage protein
MEERQLSFTDLSRQSGVSRAYLYRVLDGTNVPTMDVADKIAKALGLVITTSPAK